ncbi:unnamed protein product [Trifolium pratense]|uniref:Uncharacterized protein n=1 Tax=Trifolium pratense TaxID=57577 RepID=A0ACB0M235_TRIPR|nr:unnamed protein product [Trifolium pratense]
MVPYSYILQISILLSSLKLIYLVGDSLGGCFALVVAARNPTVDLVLILVNPGKSVTKQGLVMTFVQPVVHIYAGIFINWVERL